MFFKFKKKEGGHYATSVKEEREREVRGGREEENWAIYKGDGEVDVKKARAQGGGVRKSE